MRSENVLVSDLLAKWNELNRWRRLSNEIEIGLSRSEKECRTKKKLHCELCSMKWKRASSCRRTLIFTQWILHHLHFFSSHYFFQERRRKKVGKDHPLEGNQLNFITLHPRSTLLSFDMRLIFFFLFVIENPQRVPVSNSRACVRCKHFLET